MRELLRASIVAILTLLVLAAPSARAAEPIKIGFGMG
jgi:hypothetical protein